jgi:hypothetical protein
LNSLSGWLEENIDIAGEPGEAVINHRLSPDNEISNPVFLEKDEKILDASSIFVFSHTHGSEKRASRRR